MESNQTSEQIVIPDISDPLANNPEEHQNITLDRSKCSVVTSVSEGLAVGSLIGVASPSGTTFNVITHDQLQVGRTAAPLFYQNKTPTFFNLFVYFFSFIYFFSCQILISLKDQYCASIVDFYVKPERRRKMKGLYELG